MNVNALGLAYVWETEQVRDGKEAKRPKGYGVV